MRILFEDDFFLAIDKPEGLLVHPSRLDVHAKDFALFQAEAHVGAKLHTLHRLDRPTSGVLLFGKSPEIARKMLNTFVTRDISKQYLCVARGWTKNSGRFDAPLEEIQDKIADKMASANKPAQPAVTLFKKLAHNELDIPVGNYPKARYSLCVAFPETGRQHQIRRHFKKASHHLLGDSKYGDGKHNKMFRSRFDWDSLCLRAYQIQFTHPETTQSVVINAGLNAHWEHLLVIMGWNYLAPQLHQEN